MLRRSVSGSHWLRGFFLGSTRSASRLRRNKAIIVSYMDARGLMDIPRKTEARKGLRAFARRPGGI